MKKLITIIALALFPVMLLIVLWEENKVKNLKIK